MNARLGLSGRHGIAGQALRPGQAPMGAMWAGERKVRRLLGRGELGQERDNDGLSAQQVQPSAAVLGSTPIAPQNGIGRPGRAGWRKRPWQRRLGQRPQHSTDPAGFLGMRTVALTRLAQRSYGKRLFGRYTGHEDCRPVQGAVLSPTAVLQPDSVACHRLAE